MSNEIDYEKELNKIFTKYNLNFKIKNDGDLIYIYEIFKNYNILKNKEMFEEWKNNIDQQIKNNEEVDLTFNKIRGVKCLTK